MRMIKITLLTMNTEFYSDIDDATREKLIEKLLNTKLMIIIPYNNSGNNSTNNNHYNNFYSNTDR